jgi:hypothetical protein
MRRIGPLVSMLIAASAMASCVFGRFCFEVNASQPVDSTGEAMSHQNIKVVETEDYLDLILARDLESRLFVHGRERFIAVSVPGKVTVSPSIESVLRMTFQESQSSLRIEWTTESSGVESATLRAMDRPTWERLRTFVTRRFGSKPALAEE